MFTVPVMAVVVRRSAGDVSTSAVRLVVENPLGATSVELSRLSVS